MHPKAAPHGRVLIIAGSDSGGGAGIQGDIKTVSALGGYAMTAITALTAQNTQGVFGIHPVPEDFIAQQMALCLSDIGADAIKTGMLHSASAIHAIADALGSSLPLRGRDGVGAPLALASPTAKKHLRLPLATTLRHAKELRRAQTDAEKKLWRFLRAEQRGAKFRKQHPFGPYILDFICLEAQLVIELDGGQHAEEAHAAYDVARTAFLQEQGLRVLRFWNHDVLQNVEGVVSMIQSALGQATPQQRRALRPHPIPPPRGEGVPVAPALPNASLLTTHDSRLTTPLVLDPVMVAKGGAPLLEAEALHALKTLLIPRASIITPNLPEAELLLGRSINSDEADCTDMKRAAEELLKLGCDAVLLKGGHGNGNLLTDILVTRHQAPGATPLITLSTPRLDTRHTHGTGCAFASAIATGLAQKLSLEDSVRRAHAYVQGAIARAPGFGQGHGPLGH